ncbi:hypothetical protein LWM68_09435 [Niabella sp. W65]|jgi:hypothetical protein|nr:hypothetical protein [Niabella sp. W65]MCH7362971.1 hypothetical protein [Niabella sp. W65]ULT38909.1 hypothetical protein KRR40_28100 [Niabella sp. I65]
MSVEAIIEEQAYHFLKGLVIEFDGDREALFVIRQFLSTGSIDASQEHLLKTQLADTLKIAGIGIPFILIPGASVLMPILLRVASKYRINLLPVAFSNNKGAV